MGGSADGRTYLDVKEAEAQKAQALGMGCVLWLITSSECRSRSRLASCVCKLAAVTRWRERSSVAMHTRCV